MEWLYTYKKYLFVVGGLVIAFLVYFSLGAEDDEETIVPFVLENIEEVESEEPAIIYVDVKGAVVKEGVYSLPLGARVTDVIELAGGFLPEANKNAVNLAQVLVDEMLLYVPLITESTQTISTIEVDDGKINLNTATSTELETLPGIGPSRAIAIIEYREANGAFQSIDELKNVSGIGDKTYEKLKENIKIK